MFENVYPGFELRLHPINCSGAIFLFLFMKGELSPVTASLGKCLVVRSKPGECHKQCQAEEMDWESR